MELRFIKVNPTENMTILVRDTVPRAQQPAVAAALMASDSVGGEQVGFIEPPTLPGARARLQMMGGEFCGNASMSLAAVLAGEDGLTEADVTLEVSGCDTPVVCRIETRQNGVFGTVSMPLPERTDTVVGLPAVFFPGIVHLIAAADDFETSAAAEDFLRRISRSLALDAAGLLLYDEPTGRMTPCVFVRATDSAVWERGCASGTAALGAHLALTKGLLRADIHQPGGTIRAQSRMENGQLTALSITGSVRIAAWGTAAI